MNSLQSNEHWEFVKFLYDFHVACRIVERSRNVYLRQGEGGNIEYKHTSIKLFSRSSKIKVVDFDLRLPSSIASHCEDMDA